MPENPYAAPQSSLDQPAPREFGESPRHEWAERDAVAEGTRLLLLAVWFTLASIVVVFVGVFVLNLITLAGLILLILLACAAICHGRGLYELLRVTAETRARGLITVSLTTFLIAVVGNILEGVAKASRLRSMGIEFNLGQAVLSLTMYSTLALALVRIARYYHADGARWCAQVTLAIIMVCYGALVLFYIAVLTPAGLEWLQTWRTPEGRRIGTTIAVAALGLGLAGAGFYLRSLWLLRKNMREML
jgi:uncharacterized membrane protein